MMLDLYGRNPNVQDTTFNYPSTRMPMQMAGPTYLQLSSGASRVFGNPTLSIKSLDDTIVGLDPSSVYERTQRWKGIGGLGAPPSEPGVTKRFSNEYLDFAHDNPTAMFAGLAAITLIALGILKLGGKAAG